MSLGSLWKPAQGIGWGGLIITLFSVGWVASDQLIRVIMALRPGQSNGVGYIFLDCEKMTDFSGRIANGGNFPLHHKF